MIHVMVDLETVSLENNAALLSMGACIFDKHKVLETYYEKISLDSCIERGLHVSSDTIGWWATQDESVRAEAFSGTKELCNVLQGFTYWLTKNKSYIEEPVAMWGNGAVADNVWLKSAFTACHLEAPWDYKRDRCYRTAVAMLSPMEWVQPTVRHMPLDDAIAQAKTLIGALKLRGLPL